MLRLPPFAFLLLTACVSEAIGPSLAKRPIEKGSWQEPERPAPAPADADAKLSQEIADLVEQSRAAHLAFTDFLPRVEAAVASAGGEASESWVAAQELLSALENARAPATRALAELDALIAIRVNGGTDAGLAELETADREVASLTERQQEELDRLQARLSR